MIVAVVPAAGKSERMGQPKLLLPLGTRLVIEHVLIALARSPVDRVFVVIPPSADALGALAQQADKVEIVQLDRPTADMRASVLAGLTRAEEVANRAAPQAFLVALADQPTISSHVVRTLIDRFHCDRPSIVVPTHEGKRGHPVLFSWSMIEPIRAMPPDRGLNHLISQRGQDVVHCPFEDRQLLCDLDTPDDYARLQRSWNDNN
jgi:molybdenum cofactor cytidylyltransferase